MREALEARSGLSPEQLDTLCAFGQALIEKNKVMNLTAITEPQAVAELHFLDCIALLRAEDFSGKRVIDIGCGAGFPGVPLKIAEPSIKLTLLDSLAKRMTWAAGNSAAAGRGGRGRHCPGGRICPDPPGAV